MLVVNFDFALFTLQNKEVHETVLRLWDRSTEIYLMHFPIFPDRWNTVSTTGRQVGVKTVGI
jgi:hypothetical protein